MPARPAHAATERARQRLADAALSLRAAEAKVAAAEAARDALRDTRNEIIREEYANGADVHYLVGILEAAGIGLGRQHVHRIVQGGRKDASPLFDVADATERYRSGESLRDLGRAYGCSDRLVKKALVAAGVEIRDRETARRVHYAKDGAT